jgi:hypothetical protein
MAILDRKTFRLKKKCILVSVDDKALLFDTEKNVYFGLSEAAFSLLRSLRKPRGASFGALKAKFGFEQKANAEKSASEMSGFLKQLAGFDLLPAADKELLAKVEAMATIAVIKHGGDLICWGTPIVPKPPKPPPPPPPAYYIPVSQDLVAVVLPLVARPGGIVDPAPPTEPPKPKRGR